MRMADKFFFFSRSTDKPPGEGSNEIGDPGEYAALARLSDWRQTLSNFHVATFCWRGYTWNSIEHAFQAMKIGLQDQDKAFQFTVESGHFIGKGSGWTAQKHRKCVILTQDNIDHWTRTCQSVMQGAATAKYAQSAAASEVLDATGDAELWHIVPRGRAPRFGHLESIRTRRRAAARCAPVKPPRGDAVARKAREERALTRAEERDDEGDDFYIKYH